MADLCPRSDLLPDECAHCLGHDDSGIPTPQVRNTTGGARLRLTDVVTTFVARYRGQCISCGGSVAPGETAGWTTDRELVCQECLP